MPQETCAIRPSAAFPADPPSVRSASAEIQRARDILRDVLLRDDECDEESDVPLIGQVSDGLNEIISTLDSLAGLQQMFEAWSG